MRWIGLVVAVTMAFAAMPGAAQEDSIDDLAPGPGREETFAHCSACHGLAIVRQQGLARERWAETLRVMVERHGMAELERGEIDLILDYLAASFPPRQRGRPNPFLR